MPIIPDIKRNKAHMISELKIPGIATPKALIDTLRP
jgi:hypothetical protein